MIKLVPWLVLLMGLTGTAHADGVDEPIPSFYEEPGISRTRDYVNQHANERIDPFTGKLQWHFVDLFIPGNGGLDLKVQRSYNSLNEQLLPDYSPVGLGWTMHFGRVLRRANNLICDNVNGPLSNPVLEMPDGGRRVLYLALDHVSWITTDFWKAECNLAGGGGGLNVISPDGTRYEMTFRGTPMGSSTHPINTYYVSKVTDRNGNWINYSYAFSSDGPYGALSLITGATTSDGRSLTFNYVNQVLDTITDGGRTWTYVQTPLAGVFNTNVLKEVKRPDGNSWKFEYNETSTGNPGGYSMRQAKYPTGGTIDYTYNYINFAATPWIPRSTVVTQKVASPSDTWTWTYTPATQPITPNSEGGFDYSMPPTAAQAPTLDRTTVVGPDGTRTRYHVGYNSAFSGIAYLIGFQLGTTSNFDVESYSASPILISDQVNVRPGNSLVADGATAAVLTTSHYIGRFGESFYTQFDNFDDFGNPQTITEQGNEVKTTNLTYNIDTAKWLIRQKKNETIAVGNETLAITRSFDPKGNLLMETRAGVPTSYGYTPEGDLASRTDARNKSTAYSSYFRGIPRAESQPENVNISRSVSNDGNVTAQTDGEMATTNFTFDGLGRVTGVTHPLSNPVAVTWGATMRTVTRGPYRSVTTFDAFGREASVQHTDTIRAETITQTYKVDALGRRVFASYPNSTLGTGFNYDMLSRPTYVFNEFNPSDSSWQSYRKTDHFSYGVQVRNENGWNFLYKNRSYGSPDAKELMSIQTPMDFGGPSTTITRNVAGQMTAVTQDGVTRSYGYDSRLFLTSMTEPETGLTTMGRDAVGNLTSRQVGISGQTAYAYDDRGRLTTITYPAGTPGVVKTYFKDDKLKSIDNGIAQRDYVYDTNKNLTSETLKVGTKVFPITYGYDGNDAHASLQYGSTKVVTYAPDAFGRPRQAAPYVTTVAYHPTGQASSFTYANGVQTTVGLDGRQRPASLQIAKSSNLFNTSYFYDPVGNVAAIEDAVDTSYNKYMSYDALDRLRGADGPWGSGVVSYDLRGNITDQSFGTFGLTYAYDPATQRLASVTGSKAYTMNYDFYGNVTANGTTTFTYNDAANMQCAQCGQANEILFDYDGTNQRVWKRKGGLETFFVYGVGGQLLWEETPGSALKEYIYLGGKQIATREQVLP